MDCNRFIKVLYTPDSTKISTEICHPKLHSKAVILFQKSLSSSGSHCPWIKYCATAHDIWNAHRFNVQNKLRKVGTFRSTGFIYGNRISYSIPSIRIFNLRSSIKQRICYNKVFGLCTSRMSKTTTENFFSDKVRGQMNSINAVISLYPSLCLWRMKRTIKWKIEKLRSKKKSFMDAHIETALLFLINRYFFQIPYIALLGLTARTSK